ncbi:hypothetical protein [Saccharicrinis aurantiacus]|uniref:hypothetical protein n=1 Tax=Saccharicrinis aurantiacus TaxID=1849719 RepID=UPI0015C55E6D|nr:hypothetical protein [Saccharicrinis aurantiacus]
MFDHVKLTNLRNSEVGKLIWKGKNEAFYNDYVIYGSSKSMLEESDAIVSDEIITN